MLVHFARSNIVLWELYSGRSGKNTGWVSSTQRARSTSSVVIMSLQYFSTLSHKRHDFRGKKELLKIECVFWFSLQILSETHPILKIIERDILINVRRS